MSKTIIFDADARNRLKVGVDTLANSVKVTMGPGGRNVVIARDGGLAVTKDGVSVAREVVLSDHIADVGAQMVKQVAHKVAQLAGDGTTTATVLTQEIFNRGLKAVATGANPIELKRGMDAALTEIVAALSQSSIPVKDLTHIHQVATISANNDESMGALITQCMEAVGFDGIITVEQSKSAETYVDIVEGMQFKSGYLSPYFINSNEKPQVEFENALVLLVDGKVSVLNDIVQFLEYSNQKGRPLLVISESVDGDALNTMVLNKLRGTIKAAAVRAPGFGELRKENLDDIAILTGAKTVSEREGYSLAETIASEVLGSATKVIVTADSTTIIGGEGLQDSIKERISDINAQIENSTSESATLILKERLARIDGGVAIIKVGAHSEIEMREKIDRIDDAIGATRAAVEEGIVVGGGVALCKIAEDLTPTIAQTQNFEHRLGRTILLESCLAPFRVILTNAGESPDAILSEMKNRGQEYNVKTREYCNFIDSGIIDPAKVARVAIENAVSIASMMLTTEVLMVQDPPTETKA